MVKQWAPFLVAALLILGGLYFLLVTLGYVEAIGPLPWALLSGLGGLAFLAIYLQDRQEWWPLIPGAALLSLSLTILLDMAGLPSGVAGSALFLGTALGFLPVYLADRRENWWAIIPAGALVSLGVVALLSDLVAGELVGSLFLLGLAAIFAALYFMEIEGQRRNWWALIPAGVLTVLATMVILSQIVQGGALGAFFFLGLAAVFGLLYLIRSEERELGWAKFPALGLAAFGLFVLAVTATGRLMRFWPLLLILAGLIAIWRGWRGR